MIFTQKTHATLHLHLDNLRKRSAATQNTLRTDVNDLQARLRAEMTRVEKLQQAIEEMSEGFSRETAGRRREVILRLSMLAEEEKRYRRVEIWLDKVHQMREGGRRGSHRAGFAGESLGRGDSGSLRAKRRAGVSSAEPVMGRIDGQAQTVQWRKQAIDRGRIQ